MNPSLPAPGSASFTPTQKEYLQGFSAGLAAAGLLPAAGRTPAGAPAGASTQAIAEPAAPPTWFGYALDEITNEERLKRERNPLDILDTLLAHAREDRLPQAGDVYRFKSHGLFNVAPAQQALMVRVRVPGNVLRSGQLRALAGIAQDLGGGCGHVTTRGNIQIREIAPRHLDEVLMRLAEAGLQSLGAGADNIRNVTASPTAGFDAQELIDTRPLARAMQFTISNSRDLFGLPRKFNICFDGGGRVSNVSDTNDIGFIATQAGEPAGVAPGVYFRVWLAGISGHGHFAQDCGLLVAPDECVAVAAAMTRVFAEHGDRTDRRKARLVYLLERIGVAKFLALTQEKLAFPLRQVVAERCAARLPVDKHGHLGVHAQRQPGLHYLGIAMPVGLLSAAQMRALADLAERCGSGDLRTTVWQNMLLPDVPAERLEEALAGVRAAGYDTAASSAAGCVVACTGNRGCRFAASDTKTHAVQLMKHLDASLKLDTPVNIHVTGCPHSCAQHNIADIGLLGAQVQQGEGSIEGYHLYVGGGVEEERGMGRELARSVPHDEVPVLVERLLAGYLAQRAPQESFVAFARRHDLDALRRMALVDAA
jgi:ferredoxin-nitrite reductase